MSHTHGAPDNEAEHLDDILGRGAGDPDVHGYVQHTVDNPHWSELPNPVRRFEPTNWTDSDNDARSPLEADQEENGL